MQLAALSEVGRLEIRVDGYTYFWSGTAEGHTQSVTTALQSRISSSRPWTTFAMSESLRLVHSQGALTVVSVCPNKLTGINQTKIKRRETKTPSKQLDSIVEGHPAGHIRLVLGNFNAQVVGPHGWSNVLQITVSDSWTWPGVTP